MPHAVKRMEYSFTSSNSLWYGDNQMRHPVDDHPRRRNDSASIHKANRERSKGVTGAMCNTRRPYWNRQRSCLDYLLAEIQGK